MLGKAKRTMMFGLAAVLLVTGCASERESSPSASQPAGGAATGGGDKIKLKIISATVVENPEGTVEKKFAEEYMAANPHIDIEFIGTPMNEVYAKIMTMATGGDVPDIFINSPEFYAQAAEMGLAEDLNGLFDEEFIEGFHPATLKQAMIDGRLEYAPWFTIPTGLLYRKDWFEEEGIKLPETWDEFIDAAKKLTKDTDGDGNVDRWGYAMVGSKNGSGGSRFVPIMRTFGAAELIRDENGQWITQFDSPEAIEALQFYGDLVNVHEVVPPGPFQTSYAEAVSLMASEKTAMMVTGPHSIGAILQQNPSLEGKLAGIPLPHAPGKESVSVLGMLGFSVSAKSKHKEEAAKYLQFLLEKSNQLEWNAATGRFPVRLDASEDPQIQSPTLAGFLEAMDKAFEVPNVSYYAQVQLASAEAYQAVIAKQSTAEEAAKKIAADVRKEIDNN